MVSAPQSGGADNLTQPAAELRLAVAFTGGVSLAVWMGGIAREMNLLLAASSIRGNEPVADPFKEDRNVPALYAKLLNLLNVDCTMDVLSGTSAGGINAIILGLANVQQFDLDGLRQLWFDEGSLGNLLRDPADKQAASLLYGDKVLLQGLRTGLKKLAGSRPENPAAGQDPTRVFITTTLLTGEASTFTDEYDTLIRDTDHHGLFRFTSAQLTPANVDALALAARCSASFPVAFEPGLIPIGTDGGEGHPDMAPFTGTTRTQFAADGGLLANRPLGPALQAVFDRPADREVRRVLAFVVPTVGGSEPSAAKLTLADTPGLGAALAADAGAVLGQTISAELAAITLHNQQVRARNDARQQLAVLGAQMARLEVPERLGAPFYRKYRTQRADSIARAASARVMKRLTVGQRASDGRPVGYGNDARDAWNAANTAAEEILPPDLPAVGDYDGLKAAGREALDEGRATVLAMLRCAYRLVSSGQGKRTLGDLRAQVSEAMPDRPESTAADRFTRVLDGVPQAPGAATLAAQAAVAAQALLDANMASSGQPWSDLATVVIDLYALLSALGEPDRASGDTAGNALDSAGEFVWDLLDYLIGSEGDDPNVVAARLFDLQVARYAMQLDGVVADQAVELVQMSSDTRTELDVRTLAAEKLTGLGLHHFGAFYKASWRANDWMWGRIDGAGWLVHLLLDPRRLYQLGNEAEDPEAFRANLRLTLEQIAGSTAPPGVWEPFSPQDGSPGAPPEMGFLTANRPPPPPTSLPVTAMWVAAGLQRLIAGEELKHVAEQVGADEKQGAEEDGAKSFLSAYHSAVGDAAVANGSYPAVPEGKAADVLRACRIPAEKITSELGSQLFSRTATRAAAVAVNMVDLSKAMPVFVRPVLAAARTITLVAYRVTTVGPAARYPLFAGLALIALGMLASTSTIGLLNGAGLLAVLVGLVLLAVGAARRILLASVAVAAGAALAAAAYIPIVRDHLFPWLENTAIPDLSQHPAEWAVLVMFVLLPPIWTIVVVIQTVTERRKTSKTAVAAPAAAADPVPNRADGSTRQN